MKKKYTLIGFILEKKLLSIAFLAATVILSVAAPLKSYIIQWLRIIPILDEPYIVRQNRQHISGFLFEMLSQRLVHLDIHQPVTYLFDALGGHPRGGPVHAAAAGAEAHVRRHEQEAEGILG